MSVLRVGVVGGGLMGREVASAMGRWCALEIPVQAELVAVCDVNEAAREWFRRVPTVRTLTDDLDTLLQTDVDAVYVAVPHHLHEAIYVRVLEAGKDLLGEKPFGIDFGACQRILSKIQETGRFVRCSSEFPFFPGAWRAFQYVREGHLGVPIEFRSSFSHASDLDPTKPINWKRRVETCGEIGVMGDLGMHVAHLPFRLGLHPQRVFAQLLNIVPERPDGKGGRVPCDTWDNALLSTYVEFAGREVPLRLETRRLAPGETNTWEFEALGTDGGVRFSTKHPKTLWTFSRGKEQAWTATDLGHGAPFPTITGGIFEFGFPDALLQMWAAFAMERAGLLGDRMGCATPEEALLSHRVFAAALRSHAEGRMVSLEQ